MAIKNTVYNDFWFTFVDSLNSFDCRLPGVFLIHQVLGAQKNHLIETILFEYSQHASWLKNENLHFFQLFAIEITISNAH